MAPMANFARSSGVTRFEVLKQRDWEISHGFKYPKNVIPFNRQEFSDDDWLYAQHMRERKDALDRGYRWRICVLVPTLLPRGDRDCFRSTIRSIEVFGKRREVERFARAVTTFPFVIAMVGGQLILNPAGDAHVSTSTIDEFFVAASG